MNNSFALANTDSLIVKCRVLYWCLSSILLVVFIQILHGLSFFLLNLAVSMGSVLKSSIWLSSLKTKKSRSSQLKWLAQDPIASCGRVGVKTQISLNKFIPKIRCNNFYFVHFSSNHNTPCQFDVILAIGKLKATLIIPHLTLSCCASYLAKLFKYGRVTFHR